MATLVSPGPQDVVSRLMRENAHLRAAQRLAGVGHFVHDRRTDTSEWSDALHDILGYPLSQTPSLAAFLARLDPADAARFRDEAERASNENFSTDFRFTRADDGRVRYGRVTGLVERDATRRPISVTGIVQDITVNKAAEQAARAAERRLESIARLDALGAFSTHLAHELNNLITIMVGSAELIDEDVDADDALRVDVDALVTAADRARHLTARLLGFARPTAGSDLPQPIEAMLRELIPTLEATLGPRGTLRLELDAPDAATTLASASLERVLVELALNARDAMPDGGELTVRATIGGQGDSECIHLDVIDTGVGMSSAVRHRAFDPFFTTRGTPGVRGIGLAACHTLIGSVGGRIDIRQSTPAGTCIAMRLPRHAAPPATVRTSGDTTVLLVDDDPALHRIVARGLRQFGYRVIGGTDPTAVLDAARSGQLPAVDVVLSDVSMPGLTGPALVTHLRHLRPGLPALLMTGGAPPPQAESIEVPVIHKPFTLARLCALVRQVIDRCATPALAEPTGPRTPNTAAAPGR